MTWLALSDSSVTTLGIVIVALISATGTVFVAFIGRSSRNAIDEHAKAIKEELVTENGHTIGQATSHIEDKSVELTDRLDKLQVVFNEHVVISEPIVEWVRNKMREESARRDRRKTDGGKA